MRSRVAHDARLAAAAGREAAASARSHSSRLGKLHGERALADALGPDEQIRRRQPPRRDAAAELLDDVVVSVKALPHGVIVTVEIVDGATWQEASRSAVVASPIAAAATQARLARLSIARREASGPTLGVVQWSSACVGAACSIRRFFVEP